LRTSGGIGQEQSMTTETREVLLFAVAGAAGIVLALLGSTLISYLDRRGRFFVFGWMDSEHTSQGSLSVYVSNKSRSRAVVREAGVVMEDGDRLPVTNAPELAQLSRPLPLTVGPGDVTQVCVVCLPIAHAGNHPAACYVVRDRGRVVVGQIFTRGEAPAVESLPQR
jgi:hypothetical protein